MSVGSDYSEILDKHKNQKSENIHPLIDRIARYREEKLDAAIDSAELYKPELTIYLRTKSVSSKKMNFLKKKRPFLVTHLKNYDETLEVLFQNIDTLISSLASNGLTGRLLEVQEMQNQIYKMLNPKRSAFEPAPMVKTLSEDNLESETLDHMEWLAVHHRVSN